MGEISESAVTDLAEFFESKNKEIDEATFTIKFEEYFLPLYNKYLIVNSTEDGAKKILHDRHDRASIFWFSFYIGKFKNGWEMEEYIRGEDLFMPDDSILKYRYNLWMFIKYLIEQYCIINNITL